MAMAGEAHTKEFWTTIAQYGFTLAALVFVLKYIEYRYLLRDLRVVVYIGVVAMLFTALSIWVGSKLLSGRKVAAASPVPNKVDEAPFWKIFRLDYFHLENPTHMCHSYTPRAVSSGILLILAVIANAQGSCLTALPISPGTYAVPGYAGGESPASVCVGNWIAGLEAVWYRYTPSADATTTVTSSISSVDTRLHIFSGECGALICVVGDDDSGVGSASYASFNAEAGVAYTIVFDDIWSTSGFSFQVVEGPPVDEPVDAVAFTSGPLPQDIGAPMTVVDMDGDHLDDIVVTSTNIVRIGQQLNNGTFVVTEHPFPVTQNTPGFSVAAGDMDNNGYTDLLYGSAGPTLLLRSDDGSTFNEWSNETWLFAQRTNMVDINNDGYLDGFYCHDTGVNHYYFSDGQGGFTEGSGELSVLGGNYGSIWIDFDGDGDIDMFNTKCGGGSIDELYRNDGGGQYTNVAPAMGFADTHNAWSTAWGDNDNDGDMDAFVGQSGSAFHKLMRNDGDVFTNITIGSGTEAADGSIEWRTHDFNNDGFLDILGQSEILYNHGNMTFGLIANMPFNGPIGDLNADGFLDMVSNGDIFYNNGNANHWLKVALEGTVSNRMGVGARVTVVTAQGTQIRDIISGDGCRYMSTLNAHFGLGAADAIQQVEVRWPSGIIDVVQAPPVDGTLVVEEGLSTRVVEVSPFNGVGVFPNPVGERLSLSGMHSASAFVRITDGSGRVVLGAPLLAGSIDVSGLSSGTYLILVIDGVDRTSSAFVKE